MFFSKKSLQFLAVPGEFGHLLGIFGLHRFAVDQAIFRGEFLRIWGFNGNQQKYGDLMGLNGYIIPLDHHIFSHLNDW